MTADLPDRLAASGKRMSILATALGSQLPGISFFLGLAPPGFPAIVLLTGGGTLAIFLLRISKQAPDPVCIQKGARSIAAALILATVYGFLFSLVTVGPPASRSEHVRYQVGFGLTPFSLTVPALRLANEHPAYTKEDLMLAFGAYDDTATSRIWKSWSIYAAGALLIVTFVFTYYYWTSGLGWLACTFSATSRKAENSPRQRAPESPKRSE